MSDITPTFQGEALLRRWSESSTQGVQVTFALADSGDLEPLKAKTGKRFACVLVEIGDDEQPVPPVPQSPPLPNPRPRMGSYCYQAVLWCQSPEFRQWILEHTGAKPPFTEADARAFVIAECEVDSRKEIDLGSGAQKLWQERIAGPYRKWLIARGLE